MTRYIVIADWTASYPDPIRVSAGEPVTLDGREEIWDGHRWLWARSGSGKEGWVPDRIVETRDDAPVVVEDYAAMELTCRKGETLVADTVMHGWIYCVNKDGVRGWVPERNVKRLGVPERRL